MVFFWGLLHSTVCFSISTPSASRRLSAVTGSLTAQTAAVTPRVSAFAYAELDSGGACDTYFTRKRGKTFDSKLWGVLTCAMFWNSCLWKTVSRNLSPVLPGCRRVFSLYVMGYFRCRQSNAETHLCVCQGGLDSRPDQTLFIRFWKSPDRSRLCHFDKVALRRLFRAICLWFQVPYGIRSQVNYPQPLYGMLQLRPIAFQAWVNRRLIGN